MTVVKKMLKSYFFYTVSAFGISLTIIANVGVSSYNSMNLAIANASDIKIGTITIFLNGGFLLLYMVLTRFSHKYKYLIQALSVLLFGTLINFFTYSVLNGISDLSYIQRIVLISTGTFIGGLSIGMIVHYNVITFPLESVCLKLADLSGVTFMKLRYLVDILSISVSIAVSMMNHLPLYVREGTIISMLIFSASVNMSKEYFAKKPVEND